MEDNGVGANPDRSRVVHVSADFPDPFDAEKTKVIRTLVDLTADQFDHQVYSLNRRSPSVSGFLRDLVASRLKPCAEFSEQAFEYGKAVRYTAPGKGLYHASMLGQVGDWLAADMASGRKPDLIIGHKLSVEGLAVMRAAQSLDCPFALLIQGDTDTKILAARPDLTALYREAFRKASLVFSFAPWSLDAVTDRLGPREGASVVIPCPTELDTPVEPRKGDGLLSAFHLKSYRRKNLAAMGAAMRVCEREGEPLSLAVVGGGEAEEVERAKSVVKGTPGLVFEGPVSREDMQARMNRATGFVLPSKRESFGLVFIEALMAGLPVIYPEGIAISGYFDDYPFAIPVMPGDTNRLARAMRRLVEEEKDLKAELALWQKSEHALQFRRTEIGKLFAQGLQTAAGSFHRQSPGSQCSSSATG